MRKNELLRKSMRNISEKVDKFYYVPSKSGFKKLVDFNPSATLAPHRTIETGVVAETISIIRFSSWLA